MFSDIVYLYGDKFSPEANILHFRETLPNGKKVDQKKLSNQIVLAALSALYSEKDLDFYIEEGKFLFIKTKTVKAKKIKDSTKLGGLEKALFENIKDNGSIRDSIRSIIRYDSFNPWQEITKIVKKELPAKDNKKDEEGFNEYTAVLKELKSKGELLEKLKSTIESAIESRLERVETNFND